MRPVAETEGRECAAEGAVAAGKPFSCHHRPEPPRPLVPARFGVFLSELAQASLRTSAKRRAPTAPTTVTISPHPT
jgi:hypothetical protein